MTPEHRARAVRSTDGTHACSMRAALAVRAARHKGEARACVQAAWLGSHGAVGAEQQAQVEVH